MLLGATVQNDKIVVDHVQKIDEIVSYCRELSKDESNGFTKDRTMRRLGSFPVLTLMDFDKTHPGWYQRAMNPRDLHEKQAAWREFLASDHAKPFMMVEKVLH